MPECPDSIEGLQELEKLIPLCRVTLYNQAKARIETGSAKSVSEASRQLADEMDKNPDTVRRAINREENKIGTLSQLLTEQGSRKPYASSEIEDDDPGPLSPTQPFKKCRRCGYVHHVGPCNLGPDSCPMCYPPQKIIHRVALGEKEILETAREIQSQKREAKREIIIQKLEAVESIEAKEIQGVYDVIVIDPPWPMVKIERDERPNQSEFDYPVMTEEELCDLSIPSAEDCHVWLWSTHKYLPMAFRLLEKWDLKYSSCMTWHKNGGFQVAGFPQLNCEFCLYARKGNPFFIDTKDFKVCFHGKRRDHSRKPEEFYQTITRVTAGRRLDMFTRESRNGWIPWGNEIDKFKD